MGATFCSLLTIPPDPPLDHDEIYWVGSAYYYDLAFVQKDWHNPAWGFLPARENPPVAKYVLGLGLAAAGHRVTTIDSLSYFYLFWLGWEKSPEQQGIGLSKDMEKRVDVVNAATPGFRQRVAEQTRAPLNRSVIRAGRNTVIVCSVVASLLLFLLSASGGDWFAALISSQLFLLHPIVVAASSHAMSDAVAAMFSIAAALSAYWWWRRVSAPSANDFSSGVGSSIIAGVVLGLACGAKMNSLVIAAVVGLLTAIVTIRQWLGGDRLAAIRVCLQGAILFLVALLVFVFVNPAILRDPVGGLAATVVEHSHTEKLQTDLNFTHLEGLGEKFGAVVSMGFFGWALFSCMAMIVFWAIVCRWKEAGVRFAVCWWVIAAICVTIWVPFRWPRYVMPLVPPSAWLVGCFLSAALRKLGRLGGKGKRVATSELHVAAADF